MDTVSIIAGAFGDFEREAEPVLLATEAAKDLIARLDQAGYVIAPKEPTEAMCEAAFNDGWVATTTDYDDFARWYKAMINAR